MNRIAKQLATVHWATLLCQSMSRQAVSREGMGDLQSKATFMLPLNCPVTQVVASGYTLSDPEEVMRRTRATMQCKADAGAVQRMSGRAPSTQMVGDSVFVEEETMTGRRGWSMAGNAGLIRCLAAAVAVSLISVGSAIAADNVWRCIGPYGGTTYSVTVDPSDPQTVYVGGQVGTFKSRDGGGSWTSLPESGSNVKVVAVDPRDSRVVYTGADFRGIRKSIDGGASWTPIDSGLPSGDRTSVTAIVIMPSGAEAVYIVTSDGSFKSTDGGSSWNALSKELPDGSEPTRMADLKALVLDPADPLTMYAGGNGVFKSTDGGVSWISISSGLPSDKTIIAIALSPSDAQTMFSAGLWGGFYKSVDGGTSWVEVSSGLPENLSVNALAYDKASPPALYAAGYPGVYKSADNGVTWTAANTGLPEGVSVDGLAVALSDPVAMYATRRDGVYKTVNGGTSWTSVNNNLAGHSVRAVVVVPSNPVTVYAANSGFVRTADGGSNWETMDPGDGRVRRTVLAGAVDPSDPKTVYFESGDLYKTTDGGATWSPIWKPSGLEPGQWRTDVRVIAVDPNDSETIYIGMAAGVSLAERRIQKSTDGGQTWIPVDSGLNEKGSYTAIAIDPSNSQVLYTGGGSKGVYKSVDGAASWTNINPDINLTAIVLDPVDPNTVYVAGRAVNKSTDGGTSWNVSLDIPTQTLAIDPKNPRVLYAGTYDGVLRSTDGGATWADFSAGLPATRASSLALDAETQTVYASMSGGIYAVEVSDAGERLQTRGIDPVSNTAVLNVQILGADGAGSSAAGLEVAFSRAVSGRLRSYEWKATTNAIGRATVIIVRDSYRKGGAGGYYCAQAADAEGNVVGSWGSVPIRGGCETGLRLPIGGPAEIVGPAFGTPMQAAAKVAGDGAIQAGVPFALSQNYPNPFNPETQIAYGVPETGHVRITVYNLIGQTVRTIVDGIRPAGSHRARWNGRDDQGRALADGVYLYRIEAGGFSAVRRMVLLK
jgi:hypothetical protein